MSPTTLLIRRAKPTFAVFHVAMLKSLEANYQAAFHCEKQADAS
jgi:hypothetical protein